MYKVEIVTCAGESIHVQCVARRASTTEAPIVVHAVVGAEAVVRSFKALVNICIIVSKLTCASHKQCNTQVVHVHVHASFYTVT